MLNKILSILGKIFRILLSFATLPETKYESEKPEITKIKEDSANIESVNAVINQITKSIAPKKTDWKDNETDYKDILAALTNPSREKTVYNSNLSKYFKLKEMMNYNNGKDTFPLKAITPTILANMKNLCLKMDTVREFYGKPVTITSGFRTDYWNKIIGGETNSKHLEGKAMDVYIKGVSSLTIQQNFDSKWDGGLGTYPPIKNKRAGFNHFDISSKRRWKG